MGAEDGQAGVAPARAWWIEKWVHRRFPKYPDVVDALLQDTWSALFPWVVLTGLGVVGVIWWDPDSTFVDALRHAGLVIVGLAAAWWPVLGFIDIVAAGCWLALFYWDHRQGKKRNQASGESSPDPFTGGALRKWVIVINRHLLHAWAVLAGTVLLLLRLESPWAIVLSIGSMVLLGPMFASWVGLYIAKRCGVAGKDVSHADVSWLRRPVFYAATGLAVALLLLLEGACSYGALVCFSVTILVAASLRAWTFVLWLGNYRAQDRDPDTAARRRKFRSDLARTTKTQDVLVLAVALLAPAAFPLLPVFGEQKVARQATVVRVSEWVNRQACEKPLDDQQQWPVQVFLVADNQFRALDGKPSMGHSPVIDRLVPVAVRPVELDLLSGATLDHFARTYQIARKKWPDLKWAHLGDFADLGCRSEMDRLKGVVETFGNGFLGMAPGNHDSYFTGNFAWHPDWSKERACPGGPQQRSGAAGTNARIEQLRPQLGPGEFQTSTASDKFFARVAPMGNLAGNKPVVAAFLDTSDYSNWLWIGAAGVTGAISRKQVDWVSAHVPKNALVILFQHHPYEALSYRSHSRYRALVQGFGSRLVAIVSAHTHTSQLRKPMFDDRVVPQFVVGSTTDAPQEAALLRLRSTGTGYEVDFRTIPAVARRGLDCGLRLADETPDPNLASGPAASARPPPPLTIDEDACRDRLKALEQEQNCKALFHPDDSKYPDPADLTFHSIAEQRTYQEGRARALLQCFQPWHAREVKERPLEDSNPYAFLGFNCNGDAACERLRDDKKEINRSRRTDLVCLSWAASVLQAHKHSGWTLYASTRLGWDPLATYAAWSRTCSESNLACVDRSQ